MSLGLDLSTLLSDLAAHSSVSSALRAPSCCFLQGTASVSGCLDPPRSSAMPLLALGQHLIRLSFLWIMVALFPSFCYPSCQILLFLSLLLLTDVVSLLGLFAHPSRCAASTPCFPWLLERKDRLCLYNAFHGQDP